MYIDLNRFFKKIFKKRRNDVSLVVYGKFIFSLIINKLIFKTCRRKSIKKSCLIFFPPSLGLGDLIILSRIVDIIKFSKKYRLVKVLHFAPYLQLKDNTTSSININNLDQILHFEEYILPTPSLLNFLIYLIIGKEKVKGYISKNNVNFNTKENYKIKFDDPYYFRLKPFKELYDYKTSIKPYVWSKVNRDDLKKNNSYHSIKKYCKNKEKDSKEKFLIISSYNFYKKFRPTFLHILNEIKLYKKNNQDICILILGAKTKDELIYNYKLENNLKRNLNLRIINLSGKLSVINALEIISQSSYYIGANNGLANVAQMLGINCTLIFNGPEKSKKRKFSKYANFIKII